MLVKNFKKENGKYTLNCDFTFVMYRELMLHYLNVMLRDMELQDIYVIDALNKKEFLFKSELENFKNDIWKCPTLQKENNGFRFNGYNRFLKVNVQVIFDKSTVIFDVIHSHGQEDMVDKYWFDVLSSYLDSMEVKAHESLIKD